MDEPRAPSETAPLTSAPPATSPLKVAENSTASQTAKPRTALERSTQGLWLLNCAGILLGCAPLYVVRDYPTPPTTSLIFDTTLFLTVVLSFAVLVVTGAYRGRVPSALQDHACTVDLTFAALFALLLLSGRPTLLNKPLLQIVAVSTMGACAMGALAALQRQHNVIYGYVVYWGLSLILLGTGVYHAHLFVEDRRPEAWRPRLGDLWERTVRLSPEVICSVQSDYHCSGFTAPCKWYPVTLARRLPKRWAPKAHRPQCAVCGHPAARTPCARALREEFAPKATSLWLCAGVAGSLMVAFMGVGGLVLYQSLWQEGESGRLEGAQRDRDMQQAEPIVKEILQCRMAMMALQKDLEDGKVPHQETFTQLILRFDGIDFSPVDEGPLRERLMLARKQHVDQVQQLSERAGAMEAAAALAKAAPASPVTPSKKAPA